MNRQQSPNRVVLNTPDWKGHWAQIAASQRAAQTTPPVMPQGPSYAAVPAMQHVPNTAVRSSITISAPVATVGLSIMFFLVLALGVMLGRLNGPVHTGTSLDVTKTTSATTAPTTQGHRVPNQNETTALVQARSDTGSQCWLSWSVDSYDVMCDTQHK